jgi:hydroxymethylpyrimidine pyrophosphatase-like HAD family hydrolase
LIKDIIAFGDEVNDIEMLTLVGLGIAMENADDVVKEAADQIAGRFGVWITMGLIVQ